MTSTLTNEAILINKIGKDLSISTKNVKNVIDLLEGGNTVPFIARYRKEQTGALDEVQIRDIMTNWEYLQNLKNRKEEVLRLIEEQGKLTPELSAAISSAEKLQQVEDLYRPYKQKRRTKATVAKEKGLEPLADFLLSFPLNADINREAAKYVSDEQGVGSTEEALSGAKDIIAEFISDDAAHREYIRTQIFRKGLIESKVKKRKKTRRMCTKCIMPTRSRFTRSFPIVFLP